MELSPQKRARIRKRKRLAKNRRRNQQKFEVRSERRRTMMRNNVSYINMTEETNFSTITADTFWANYKAAQDWQQRHNVAWWQARCIALEHENRILRDKVREQAQYMNPKAIHLQSGNGDNSTEIHSPEDGSLEFHVDEDMMNFLEQSIRHKMELKKIRESEDQESYECPTNRHSFRIHELQDDEKVKNIEELYGSASSKIIALETALQVSINQHRDSVRPHYWPNIPLKI